MYQIYILIDPNTKDLTTRFFCWPKYDACNYKLEFKNIWLITEVLEQYIIVCNP